MSIRAKLFLLTSFIVIGTMTTVLTLEVDYVTKILNNYFESNVQNATKNAKKTIENNYNQTLTEHSGIFSTLLNLPTEKRKSFSDKALDSSDKFIAFAILLLNEDIFTNKFSNEKKEYSTFDFSSTIENLKKQHGSTFFVSTTVNLEDGSNERVIYIISKKNITDNKTLYLISVTNGMKLLSGIRSDDMTEIYITDKKGVIYNNGSGTSQMDKISGIIGVKLSKKINDSGLTGANQSENSYVSFHSSSKYPFDLFGVTNLDIAKNIVKKETLRQISFGAVILSAVFLIVFYFSNKFTSYITLISNSMIKVANGDLSVNIPVNSKDEIGLLAFTFNWMIKKLKDYTQKEIEFAQTQSELDTANLIQSSLMPPKRLNNKRIDIASTSVAMTKCGGDWWSHFSIEERYDYICIADATGHGPSAAMVTSIAYTIFNTAKDEIEEFDTLLSPSEILARMNHIMAANNLNGISMTASILRIDHKEKKINYSNGGHLPFYYLEKGNVKTKTLPGPVVGINLDDQFNDMEIDFSEIDRLFLYTDGVIEAQNPNAKMYGKKRLRKLIKSTEKEGNDKLLKDIEKDCESFSQGIPYDDDYTLVAIDFLAKA